MARKRHFDNWLQEFLRFASFGEAPLNTLFWTGVSTIAGTLQRKVWISQGYFEWVPNFYVVLVAPPGIISKSTTASIGMNLLKEVPGVKFGPSTVTWQALITKLQEVTEAIPDPQTGDYHVMSCLTISSSEFGNLLDPQDKAMVDMLVNLWDGQRGVLEKETKTSGSDRVENPWLNLIACTTPAWITGNFPEYMIGGGFTSRCVFVYANQKRQYVAYPGEVIPKNFREIERKLIEDLVTISEMIGEYVISDEAMEWGNAWYRSHWEQKHEHLDQDQFGGYLARKQTHIHKLAMILAASCSNDLIITRKHLEQAEQVVTALEKDMPLVFSKIGQTAITKGAAVLLENLRIFGSQTQQQLYSKVFRTMSFDDFQKAILAAVQAGEMIQTQGASGVSYRLAKSAQSRNTPGGFPDTGSGMREKEPA